MLEQPRDLDTGAGEGADGQQGDVAKALATPILADRRSQFSMSDDDDGRMHLGDASSMTWKIADD